MAAPAPAPPSIDQFPEALQKYIKPLLDYIVATHIEDVQIAVAQTATTSRVGFLRGDSGLIMKITLSPTDLALTAPATGTWWLGSVSGVIAWEPTRTTCP